jgi:hypothetical protein
MTRRQLLLPIATALALLAPPTAALAVRSAADNARVVTLRTGDVARVADGRVGCVARDKSGSRLLDCRRIGALRGTYGTIVSGSKVLVVRFERGDTARVVFAARHGSARTRTCDR